MLSIQIFFVLFCTLTQLAAISLKKQEKLDRNTVFFEVKQVIFLAIIM